MKRFLYKYGLYPVKLYWFLFRPSEYGAKCIIRRMGTNQILLIRNTYGRGSWNLPGGRKRRGESSETTVKREIDEELGIQLENPKYIGTALSTFEYKKDYIDVFSAEIDHDFGNIDHNEIRDAKWFPLDDLPEALAATANVCLAVAKRSGASEMKR